MDWLAGQDMDVLSLKTLCIRGGKQCAIHCRRGSQRLIIDCVGVIWET